MTKEEALQILDTIPTISEQVDALEMAIQALSQEPTEKPMTVDEMEREYEKSKALFHKIVESDDAISRKDIQDYIAKYLSQYLYEDVRQAVEVIDAYIGDMPSVTQKSGKWIAYEVQLPDRTILNYRCSVCGRKLIGYSTETLSEAPFCHCGARMESEDKE